MGEASKIEWLGDPFLRRAGATWNRWYGCTMTGPECWLCYITRTAPLRVAGMTWQPKPGTGATTGIARTRPETLFFPIRKKDPLLIFPESLGDLWHPAIPDREVAEVWAVMLLAWWHIFQTTTKRATRQHRLLTSPAFADLVAACVDDIAVELGRRLPQHALDHARAHLARRRPDQPLPPLGNVWVGVSAGSHQAARTRIPYLHRTPAAVRWVSVEPVVDEDLSIDELLWMPCPDCRHGRGPDDGHDDSRCRDGNMPTFVDHVVIGGESGPAALWTNPGTEPGTFLRNLTVDQVAAFLAQVRAHRVHTRHVTVFVKQLGTPWAVDNGAADDKGGDWDEWPAELRVREYPAELAARALVHDPGNADARTYLDTMCATPVAVTEGPR